MMDFVLLLACVPFLIMIIGMLMLYKYISITNDGIIVIENKGAAFSGLIFTVLSAGIIVYTAFVDAGPVAYVISSVVSYL